MYRSCFATIYFHVFFSASKFGVKEGVHSSELTGVVLHCK